MENPNREIWMNSSLVVFEDVNLVLVRLVVPLMPDQVLLLLRLIVPLRDVMVHAVHYYGTIVVIGTTTT